jgi:transcriptional regulator of arginine metabolism
MRNFIRYKAMPTATAEHQYERRKLITRLLREHAVARQSQLVELLRTAGIVATQSSVSRDLKELGAAKLKQGYTLPDESDAGNGAALAAVAELVRDVREAGPNLLVVITAIGAAQRVAVTLDRLALPEVVGTLSGDDTIFIATSSSAQQRRLRGRLRQGLKKAPHE